MNLNPAITWMILPLGRKGNIGGDLAETQFGFRNAKKGQRRQIGIAL